MKPCRKYKEQIALSIFESELDGRPRPQHLSTQPGNSRTAAGEDARAPQAELLLQHLSECVACREYAEHMRQVYRDHSQRAAALPEIEAPARLHGRVRDSITRHEGVACCGIEVR